MNRSMILRLLVGVFLCLCSIGAALWAVALLGWGAVLLMTWAVLGGCGAIILANRDR